MAYFDHNATTPLTAAARAAWLAAQDDAWQNPGGVYRSAARVRVRLDEARERLAALCGAEAGRLVFTSGATEAANAVLAHLAARPGRLLLAATEHSCIRSAAERHFPDRCRWLRLDAAGLLDRAAWRDQLAAGEVAAVAVMAANNETGVLQPWRELAADCRAAGVPYVCDAAQWLGKLPASALGGADYVFASAHKWGGPKGVGLLLVPAGGGGRDFRGLLGGGQQEGRRAGTEDWPAVAALAAALEEAEAQTAQAAVRAEERDHFEQQLCAALPGAQIIGAGVPRLWNTTMVVLPEGEGQRWVVKLDRRGHEVSTAAACSAAQGRSSAVLAALGVPAAAARRALRLSAGWATTDAERHALLAALVEVRAEIAAGGAATAENF